MCPWETDDGCLQATCSFHSSYKCLLPFIVRGGYSDLILYRRRRTSPLDEDPLRWRRCSAFWHDGQEWSSMKPKSNKTKFPCFDKLGGKKELLSNHYCDHRRGRTCNLLIRSQTRCHFARRPWLSSASGSYPPPSLQTSNIEGSTSSLQPLLISAQN